MKKLIYSITIVLAALAASSCQRDVIEPESVIKDSTVEMNDFDRWLEVNFLKPYNIEFKYRYALNESDMGYYTVPADVNSSVIYAHLVKYLCIDTYDEIAGVTFTRSYFPKMFFLIGTWEYRNNGSIVLGTAEAGKKIMLAGVNELPLVFQYYEGAELDDYLNTYYIKTIHHEFTHILNQTKAFSDHLCRGRLLRHGPVLARPRLHHRLRPVRASRGFRRAALRVRDAQRGLVGRADLRRLQGDGRGPQDRPVRPGRRHPDRVQDRHRAQLHAGFLEHRHRRAPGHHQPPHGRRGRRQGGSQHRRNSVGGLNHA